MLTNCESVSFIATCNPAKARVFYEDTLRLTFVSDEYFALVFELNGHLLRIAKVESLIPATHTVLGWQVTDISAVAQGLAASGVVFEQFDGMVQDQWGIWDSPSGAKVAWFKDPDGNVLSVTQLPDSTAV